MQHAVTFIPEDRRVALANGIDLPPRSVGAVLYADISEFTPLTSAFVHALGPRLGAEAATRQLNQVYDDLIDALQTHGGAAVSFSGDGMLCWFDGSSIGARRAAPDATMAAFALQTAMRKHAQVEIDQTVSVPMGIKTTIASGEASRFLTGDPAFQRFDVLAGSTVDRTAEAEQLAQQGETLVDQATMTQIIQMVHVAKTREGASGQRYYVVQPRTESVLPLQDGVHSQKNRDSVRGETVASEGNTQFLSSDEPELPQSIYEQWLLPSIRARLSSGQGQFLGDLRPAVALFVRLQNLDFDSDAQASTVLDSYVIWVQKTLDRFGGTLIQVTTGDKGGYLYASFGAPIAHVDQEARAAFAALALQANGPETGYRPVVQIGLAQGRMRVGPYGSETRRTFGVQGRAVNLAARLMTAAKPGQIVVEQSLAQRLKAQFRIDELGEANIKGFAHPLKLYSLGPRQQTTSVTDTGEKSPLIGRSDELTLLQQKFGQVRESGHGQVVRIEGEAGIGKSRLLDSYANWLRQLGVTISIGTSQQMERNTAYLPMRQIVGDLFGFADVAEATLEEQIAHVSNVLEQDNHHWLLRLPLLGDVLGLAFPDNATTRAFEPQLRRQALTALALEVLQQKTRETPRVLLFEDAHWLDEASLDMLQSMARIVETFPVLIVVSHRPAENQTEQTVEALAALPNQAALRLESLPTDSVAALVAQHLGGAVSSLATALIERQTEGNPFFVEELASALVEADLLHQDETNTWTLSPAIFTTLQQSRSLIHDNTVWQLGGNVSLGEAVPGLPDSIHGAVLARFDNLSEPEQLTLKTASVIGSDFSPELLLAVHPASEEPGFGEALRGQCARLSERNFVHQTANGLAFKHNITQEIVYRSLLEEQRRTLHLRVGEALEQSTPDAVEQLAHHFFNAPLAQAAVRGKALTYLDDAAQTAKRDYANEAALHHLDRALSLEADWQRWLGRAQVLHTLGRREEEKIALEQLDALDEAPPYQSALSWAELYESTSHYEQAIESLEQATELARERRDAPSEARCLARLGLIAWRQGDYAAAEARYLSAFRLLNENNASDDEAADAHYGLGLVYRQQGRYDDAQTQFEVALHFYRSVEDRQNEAKTLIAIGHVENYRHALDQALDAYQAALELYRSTGDRAGVGTSLLSLAQGKSAQGKHSESWKLLQEALEIYRATSDLWWETLVWNELGIVAMLTGQLQDAQYALEHSLDMSRALGDDSGIAYTLCNLGQVRRAQGVFNEADDLLSQAIDLTRGQGDTHLEATCLLELGLVSLARSNYAQATTRAEASIKLFDELNLEENNVPNLTTLAQSALHTENQAQARTFTDAALALLRETQGAGTTFPQREYLLCARAYQSQGLVELSEDCIRAAFALMREQAEQISDLSMRRSFLEELSFNNDIRTEAARLGLVELAITGP